MRTILCRSVSITICLSHASLMQCVAPSTIQPSTLFITAHWPSPESNFFLYIGSCPLCPGTCGSVNALWIPCRNTLERWINFTVSLYCAVFIKLSQNPSSMVQRGFSSNRVKKILHLFVPHILKFSIPRSSDIMLNLNECSGSVPARS